jgi:hypothetical protein
MSGRTRSVSGRECNGRGNGLRRGATTMATVGATVGATVCDLPGNGGGDNPPYPPALPAALERLEGARRGQRHKPRSALLISKYRERDRTRSHNNGDPHHERD